MIGRVRTPVAGGHHRVAVLSLKGGVGKTTTTVGLGSTLASLRGDRVIAVDANPDRGTLSDKIGLETAATVRDLLNEQRRIRRYADVRAFTSQAASRLEVLASDRDPTISVAFSDADYCAVSAVLEHYYSICLTDCGTGLLHSAMAGVLRLADQIVLVSSPSVDGARSASATLDWLAAHSYGDLVRNAVVVLSVGPAAQPQHRRPDPPGGAFRRPVPGGDQDPVRPAPGGRRGGRAGPAEPRDSRRLSGARRDHRRRPGLAQERGGRASVTRPAHSPPPRPAGR